MSSTPYSDTQLLIDNQWCDAASRKTIDVLNPATGQAIGKVAHAGRSEERRVGKECV